MSAEPRSDRLIAVWPTDYGWAAVIRDWQLGLEIAPDGSKSIIEANSIEPSFISYWRRTAPGKIPAHALGQMILMASRSRGGEVSHYFLREENRAISYDEFIQVANEFAARKEAEDA